jgi:hypothetical protein
MTEFTRYKVVMGIDRGGDVLQVFPPPTATVARVLHDSLLKQAELVSEDLHVMEPLETEHAQYGGGINFILKHSNGIQPSTFNRLGQEADSVLSTATGCWVDFTPIGPAIDEQANQTLGTDIVLTELI